LKAIQYHYSNSLPEQTLEMNLQQKKMKLKLHGKNWGKWEKPQHNTHQNKNPIFLTLTKQQNADDVQKQHTPLFYFLISADAVQVLQQKKKLH
jgi:hypothetical protein